MTALVAIFATVVVMRDKHPPVTATTAADPSASVAPIASSGPDIITSDPMAASSAQNSAQNTAPDAGAAIVATAHPTTRVPHTTTTTAATAKKPPATTTTAPSNCDPPWTIDPATGRKKYKLECPL